MGSGGDSHKSDEHEDAEEESADNERQVADALRVGHAYPSAGASNKEGSPDREDESDKRVQPRDHGGYEISRSEFRDTHGREW